MNIVQKIRAVEHLYRTLEKETQSFHHLTQINCPESCFYCCTTSHIEASTLEFYPMAYFLYKNGKAEEILDKIEINNKENLCPVLQSMSQHKMTSGCMYYEKRGLVCRLFGNYIMTDKYGVKKVSTCKIIKEMQPDQLINANNLLRTRSFGPSSLDYYMQLQLIDYHNVQKMYPIATAIKIALDTIITHFRYNGSKAV